MHAQPGAFTCPSCGHSVAPPPPEILRVGRVTVHTATYEIYVNGELRHLPPTPTAILIAMMRCPGQVFTRDNLLNIANSWDAEPRVVEVHLSRVRHTVAGALEIRNAWARGWSLHPIEERVLA